MALRDDIRLTLRSPAPVSWEISEGLVPYLDAMARMDAHVDAISRGQEHERVWLLEQGRLVTVGPADEVVRDAWIGPVFDVDMRRLAGDRPAHPAAVATVRRAASTVSRRSAAQDATALRAVSGLSPAWDEPAKSMIARVSAACSDSRSSTSRRTGSCRTSSAPSTASTATSHRCGHATATAAHSVDSVSRTGTRT